MRILYAGSPGIAVPALEAAAGMIGDGFDLVGLLTNPDSPRGRSGTPEPTECAAAAGRFSVPVVKPEKLNADARAQVAALKPDMLISFAYGKIFGPKFLALFPLGGINIHPSLLPKYRGPTPIPAAIINRDAETGLTIQRLAAELDSGDILVQETVSLNGNETTASLGETMAHKAAQLLPDTLRGIAAGVFPRRPQDSGAATYCSLIAREDGLIDWNRSAAEIEARIRAYSPWPLSWTLHGESELFILKAAELKDASGGSVIWTAAPGQVLGKVNDMGILIQTGQGILAASVLQYRAKKALEWKAFLNGARHFLDTRLGTCGSLDT